MKFEMCALPGRRITCHDEETCGFFHSCNGTEWKHIEMALNKQLTNNTAW